MTSYSISFLPNIGIEERSDIQQYMKVEPYTSLEIPNESVIYDLSQLSPIESQIVVERFSKRLFGYQAEISDRKQYLIVFEESHVYFPQGCMKAKRMQNSVRMLSVGRNVDIAVLLVSQFASMIDKFAVKHSLSQTWLGFSREPNDLRYLKEIIGDHVKELTKLEDGQFMFMDRNGISKIAIEPFDANIHKTQIKPKIPQVLKPIETIKPKTETSDLKALSSLVACMLWFLGVVLVLCR